MEYQRKGTCGHIMATVDPHDLCPGCRECFLPDNPCVVCDSLTSDQRTQAIQARALRLLREERKRLRRAGSIGSVSASGSSQCGPLEGKGSGPPGSSLTPSVTGQGEAGITSPRSSRGRGRSSLSVESSSRAGNDGDNGRVTSRGPRSPDGGRVTSRESRSPDGGRNTSRGPWSPDGGRSARPVGSPHRGAETERRRHAYRQRSRTPVRHRNSVTSESLDSSDAARPSPTRLARDRRWTGPDRRTGPVMDRTGNGPDIGQSSETSLTGGAPVGR